MLEPHEIRIKHVATPYAITLPRRMPLPLLPKVKDELERLQHFNVIEKVDTSTEWCAPMVVVQQKTGDIRLCFYLTKLNNAVRREKLILPAVDQTLAMLSGAAVFSKLDSNSGFFQISLTSNCTHLTTFITSCGGFCFKCLLFGVTSASEVYQKRMSAILEGLEGGEFLIDDVLVFGKDQQELDIRLHVVLKRMLDAEIMLNGKSLFSQLEIKFLRHVINASGIKPDNNKVAAIVDMRAPQNVTELRSLLGLINQPLKFSDRLADISKPLRDLLRRDRQWVWDVNHDTALNSLKKIVNTAPTLALYDLKKPIQLSADNSSYGLGATLKLL